jgi:hypothetical protein
MINFISASLEKYSWPTKPNQTKNKQKNVNIYLLKAFKLFLKVGFGNLGISIPKFNVFFLQRPTLITLHKKVCFFNDPKICYQHGNVEKTHL